MINESLNFERAIPFVLPISRFRNSDVIGVTMRNARFNAKNANPSREATCLLCFLNSNHAVIERVNRINRMTSFIWPGIGVNSVMVVASRDTKTIA